jgi:hypothetical protein
MVESGQLEASAVRLPSVEYDPAEYVSGHGSAPTA